MSKIVPDLLTGKGRKLWLKLKPPTDRAEVAELLCHAYQVYHEAADRMKIDGRYITAGTGALKPHPAVADQKNAAEQFKKYAETYGLTKTTPQEADDLTAYEAN